MKILYHGSDKIVSRPLYGVGKADNDFGSAKQIFHELRHCTVVELSTCPCDMGKFKTGKRIEHRSTRFRRKSGWMR